MKESSEDSHQEELLILFYSWGNRSRKVLEFAQSHRERWYQSPVWFSQSWPSRLFLEHGFLKGQRAIIYQRYSHIKLQEMGGNNSSLSAWKCKTSVRGFKRKLTICFPYLLKEGVICYIHGLVSSSTVPET